MPVDLSQILFVAMSLVAIVLWIRFLSRGQPFVAPRPRIQSPIGLFDVGILFGCWFVSQANTLSVMVVVMGVPSDALGDLDSQQQIAFIGISGLMQLIWTGIGMLIVGFRHGHALRIFGWQPEHFWKDLKIGAVAFLMVIPVILTIQFILSQFVEYEHATFDALKSDSGMFAMMMTWFAAVLVAPVTEEIFFRGTLQAWLQRQDIIRDPNQIETISGGWTEHTAKYEKHIEPVPGSVNRSDLKTYQPVMVVSDLKHSDRMMWLPVLVSSFVFAGIHLGQGAAPIPLFVFAVALGYLYRQTGSTMICIVLHLMLNAFSMLLFTLQTLSETPV